MYYVVYGLLWLISLLPLRILYFISDLVYGLMFYIIGYRRKVVMDNLKIVFPEMEDKQRTKIAKKFYHNLIDTFIESIKMITAPYSLLEKRVSFNMDEINRYYQTGRNVQVHIAHNFNWEWPNAVFAKKNTFYFSWGLHADCK